MSLQEDIVDDILTVYNDNSTLVDLPQKTQFLSTAYDNITASALKEGIDNNIKKSKDWPAWNVSATRSLERKCLSHSRDVI